MEEEEEVDLEEEGACSVLAQESTELFHILSCQSPAVLMTLWDMMPGDARRRADQPAPTSSVPAAGECISMMLEYFSTANAAVCRNFLQCMCMLCENMPLRLESRLISVAGYPTTDAMLPAREPASLRDTDGFESSSPSLTDDKSPSPPSEQQASKRPRIDHWEHYTTAVRSLLQRRWKRQAERLVREVQLEDVWVSPRNMNRARERPDQTPGPGDRGSRTPEPDGDYGSREARVTLETFLRGSAGQVTVLLGQAGSGKTLLMSCLGQLWAQGLGPIPSSFLFVLLEFRQLNLLSHPLSLSELLFQHYLPAAGGDSEKRAVLDYLLSNPEQSCWVLDGYDEFHSKITRTETQGNTDLLDPQRPLPIVELVSGLLSRSILPGCTLVVTCRARDVLDLEDVADSAGELLGWERREVVEYVENYFGAKGHATNRALGKQAVDLLLSSQHLLAMSSLPALCNICCVCLEHLLLEQREEGRAVQSGEGGRGGESSGGVSQERRAEQGGGEVGASGGGEGLLGASTSSPQAPPSLTQVYLTVLGAFLSRGAGTGSDREGRATDDRMKTTAPPQRQSTVCLPDLSRHRLAVWELSRLAWRGLEESKILFMEQEVSRDVLEVSTKAGLFLQVELRREDGTLGHAYCFIHLTVQEFLAALRIMTSEDVTEAQLKKRFNLKTRWTTKSDLKTVFTDSLHGFVCGLASPLCAPALLQLARGSAQSLVKTRQALVLRLLKNLSGSISLTGPKVLQLCHCVRETQDCQLARDVVGTRPVLELRNIQLLPNDIDALAFVVGSVGDIGVGLDFGACSMEPECLDVLPSCRYIHSLSFRSRRYNDKFAKKLSSILPEVTTLRKLEFSGTSLTDVGAASLASALQNCPNITEINLSANNLRDRGFRNIAKLFTKLPRLTSVMLGRNSNSLDGVDHLIRKMSSCLNIQHVHADGMKEIKVTFSQNSDMNSHKNNSGPIVSLRNQSWNKTRMERLSQSLASCPAISILDLSGSQWEVETLRSLAEFLPRLNITKNIIVNDSDMSVDGLVVLTALLSTCPAVVELNARLQRPDSVSIVFSGGTDQPRQETSRKLCLSCCGLLPVDLGRVWRSFGPSSDLTLLDLSSNSLGNRGLRKLLDLLSHLSNIQEINASKNGINMEGVLMLASALCSHRRMTEVHVSDGGRDQVILKFHPNESDEEQQLKRFRVTRSNIQHSYMTKLCTRLSRCPSRLELDLSRSSLKDKAVKQLLKVLPKMTSLQRLDVSHTNMSIDGALTLVSCLIDIRRVKSVELRPESESFIQLDTVKAEQASCRLSHFSLSSDNVERLVEILEQCPQISDLDLSSNLLKDEGVKYFVDSLPRLQIAGSVNLSNNSLTQQGALDVASTLCTCDKASDVEVSLGAEERSLIRFEQDGSCGKALSVRDSSLEPDHLNRLAEILSGCPSLTKLELSNISPWPDGLQALWNSLNLLPSLHTLNIEEHWIKSEAAVSLVCCCLNLNRNIHTIRVHQTTLHLSLIKFTGPTVSGDSTDPAPSMPTEKIGLVACAVEGRHLAAMSSIIQRCPLLTELDLSHNSLGREGAEFLCSVLPSLPNLTTLSLGSKETCADVVERLSEALLHSTGIQCLNLSGHVISDRGAESLARTFLKLPCLRSVNLSHCRGWTATGALQLVKALGQCVSLEGLCLDWVPLNEDSRACLAQGLRKTSSIRRLNLKVVMGPSEAKGVLDLLAAIEGLTQMEEIDLEGWRMADRGVEQLTRLLPVWTGLRKISLSKNLINDQSGERLLEALRSCNQLEELYLSSNHLGDLSAARMALVLPSLARLTVLDISDNKLGSEGSVSLSKALVYMKNLTKIHLTSIGTSELGAVAASLANCHLIQDVSLGWNGCGDDVAVELAKVLPLCQKLVRLDLESNNVSVLGAEALVAALQSCPALQLIRLWRNQISSADTQRLRLKDRRLNFSST